MNRQLRDAYLRQANQADERSKIEAEESDAALWRRIDDSYRELAAELEETAHDNWA